jgi:hypothetical protein
MVRGLQSTVEWKYEGFQNMNQLVNTSMSDTYGREQGCILMSRKETSRILCNYPLRQD